MKSKTSNLAILPGLICETVDQCLGATSNYHRVEALESLFVVGFKDDGTVYISSSAMSTADAYFMLSVALQKVMYEVTDGDNDLHFVDPDKGA